MKRIYKMYLCIYASMVSGKTNKQDKFYQNPRNIGQYFSKVSSLINWIGMNRYKEKVVSNQL